jgi:hypothetical protein
MCSSGRYPSRTCPTIFPWVFFCFETFCIIWMQFFLEGIVWQSHFPKWFSFFQGKLIHFSLEKWQSLEKWSCQTNPKHLYYPNATSCIAEWHVFLEPCNAIHVMQEVVEAYLHDEIFGFRVLRSWTAAQQTSLEWIEWWVLLPNGDETHL